MYHFHIISALVLHVIPRIQSELAIKWLNTLVPSYCLRRNMNVVIKENIAGLHYKGTVFGLDSKEETHFSSWKKLRYFSLLTLRDIYMYMLISRKKLLTHQRECTLGKSHSPRPVSSAGLWLELGGGGVWGTLPCPVHPRKHMCEPPMVLRATVVRRTNVYSTTQLTFCSVWEGNSLSEQSTGRYKVCKDSPFNQSISKHQGLSGKQEP